MTLANLNNVDFLSARVTNYQYNPFMGVLLDQLQIRLHPQVRGYLPSRPDRRLRPSQHSRTAPLLRLARFTSTEVVYG